MPPRVKKPAAHEASSEKSWNWFRFGATAILILGTLLLLIKWSSGYRSKETGSRRPDSVLPDGRKVFAEYAGSESCRSCHQEVYDLWQRSNHGLAERLPNSTADRTAFGPASSFRHGTQQTSVRYDGARFFITSVGLFRTNETYSVARVIGRDPLRQFLVPFPGGRFQVLEAAYDPRSNEWFNVYGNEDRQPEEWGHWTGRGMNWNSMCASCHNTRLLKNYDEPTDSYNTVAAEMSVGCEACHGPSKAHDEWQKKYGKSGRKDPTVMRFNRQQILDNCGYCHSRRTDLTGDFKPGDSFFDHQSLAIVDESNQFYPDGQVHEEDYEWASFLSSRMHVKGVVCLDCHNPHSMKIVLPGNLLCMRCHDGSKTNAPIINPVEHSHHRVFGYNADGKLTNTDLVTYQSDAIKETGGQCVNCHMPQTVYMQRHWRHDHGFTIPDPLLTKQYNVPNACNRCHQNKSVDWAIEAVTTWYGKKMERPSRSRAQSIAQARSGDAAAREPLLAILAKDENAYWRAVAAGLLGRWTDESKVDEALSKALKDPHPLVRERAARALEPVVEQRSPSEIASLTKALDDPIRNVRLSAAWVLRAELTNAVALLELEHCLVLNADQPTGQMQKGTYAVARGMPEEALAHYQKAAAWDPNSATIRHDLAVTLSILGRTREAIDQLEVACRLEPNEAEYPFKLGLAWNELGALDKTIASFEKALQLDPRHSRAWYNLGLARQTRGESESALNALSRAEAITPSDARVPYARATILVQLGRTQEAKAALKRCLEIDPRSSDAQKLLAEISVTPAK